METKKVTCIRKLAAIALFGIAALAGPGAAFSQQDSRYDAGLNLPFNEKAGEVNPQTGVIGLSFPDLVLPGRAGHDFRFGRSWSLNRAEVFMMYRNPADGTNELSGKTASAAHRLGVGWSSNLPLILEDLSSGGRVLTLFLDGGAYELDQSGMDIYNPNKSNILGYDLLDLRVYSRTAGLSVRYDEYATLGETLAELRTQHPEVADQGPDRSLYAVILKDNSRIWLRQDGQVMRQDDRTGLSRIWYFYDAAGRLVLAVDSVGRKIRFAYNPESLLSSVSWDVTEVKKTVTGARETVSATRSVRYEYESAESFPEVLSLKNQVVDYRIPYVLARVIDAAGYVTAYDWQAGPWRFTYDSLKAQGADVSLLLTGIRSRLRGDGTYLSKRGFEYAVPAKGRFTKYFYQGFLEYYRLSRQYAEDRHGRVMNDTSYVYHEPGENGNWRSYSAVLTQGGVNSTYTYSLGEDKKTTHVLSSLKTETSGGFVEERVFTYTAERTKALEEVYRKGNLVYRERYQYDGKGNLKHLVDRGALTVERSYDDTYGIPIYEKKTLQVSGAPRDYEDRTLINALGQVKERIKYLRRSGGTVEAVSTERFEYDQWGNVVRTIDAMGTVRHTVYDEATHSLAVKSWVEATETQGPGGEDIHEVWQGSVFTTPKTTLRSWKVYNSDGKVWLETDLDGWAVEHFYDALGSEIETVVPDDADFHGFAITRDVDDLREDPLFSLFLESRADNHGVRTVIDYERDLVKTYTDLDVGSVRVEGKQSDGLGHVEEEVLYGAGETPYAVKRMAYDLLGRMVAMTDPDAESSMGTVGVNGVQVQRMDKTWIVKYDELGRKILTLYPETRTGTTSMKRMAYDDLANTVTTTSPEGRVTVERYDWSGNLAEVKAKGNSNTPSGEIQVYRYEYDQLNRKTKFTDPRGVVTAYGYDERNLLVEEDYGAGAGKDTLAYDDRGLLVSKTDPKGQVTVLAYDELGRNTRITSYASAADRLADIAESRTELAYDRRGKAVRIANENLIEHYLYDSAGRVAKLERKLQDRVLTDGALEAPLAALRSTSWPEGNALVFGYAYDYAGQITQMIYPDGTVVDYRYEPELGRLRQFEMSPESGALVPIVSGIEYRPSGQITRLEYGNGTEERWKFDNRKRISEIAILGASETSIEELSYEVSGDGNILAINENRYGYDGFNRIASAKTLLPGQEDKLPGVLDAFGTFQPDGPASGRYYDASADLNADGRVSGADHQAASLIDTTDTYDLETFAYDGSGNRTVLAQNGDRYTYEYGVRNRLLKVSVLKAGAGAPTLLLEYTYDANGNVVHRKTYGAAAGTATFAYDVQNRLTKSNIDGALMVYYYDNAGNRFLKVSPTASTLYLRHGQIAVAMELEVPRDRTVTVGKITRYALSGDLIAGEVATTVASDGTRTSTPRWYHLDHLNSTKVVTDSAGAADVRYVYRAFGERLGKIGSGEARHTYGGKEQDEDTDLYYFNARYYDPSIGRFISVDPIQDGSNWYVYCGNNPLSFTDPDGRLVCTVSGTIFGAIGGAVKGLANNLSSGRPLDLGYIGAYTAVGAAKGAAVGLVADATIAAVAETVATGGAGAVAGVALVAAATGAAGAITGAAGSMIEQGLIDKQPIDAAEVRSAAMIEGAFSAGGGALSGVAGGAAKASGDAIARSKLVPDTMKAGLIYSASKSYDVGMAASRGGDVLSVLSMIPDVKKAVGGH